MVTRTAARSTRALRTRQVNTPRIRRLFVEMLKCAQILKGAGARGGDGRERCKQLSGGSVAKIELERVRSKIKSGLREKLSKQRCSFFSPNFCSKGHFQTFKDCVVALKHEIWSNTNLRIMEIRYMVLLLCLYSSLAKYRVDTNRNTPKKENQSKAALDKKIRFSEAGM